ncbi:hypothetical protein Ae406Ps2_1617 [Pseudonocardia sp. Ae406_Ps2]|uniref:hypothetical protein n=1 Tax=unclassified Pseudonocardia TaxID=2619320 RepID=UPI00094EA161|nr:MULTISPECIES: hypothetical protein [unclassified Pseudonocardia]OLL87018.1 hypothetical protein Ae263Ps1_4073c [Pseudonocardia sp. Ae263_Ps1]OLM01617.1 hypothetical protein Ae406Ps2_1617 [Pseudonocardia sp. Ae406_Ps2]OLM13338.1 hypothetical protein Ae505Ps2_3466c [Pseudonocardia sp. Ae505_Ps2]OLM23188.1 hypothetical protein Ae706Ps2_1621 [Pseudonocardia sp. Ae706_Ps2]
MRVVDAHRRRVLDQVRGEFWRRSGAGVALVVLTGVFVVLALGAAGPLDGVAGALVWVAVGAAGAEALSSAVVGWREWRRLRSNDGYLSAVVEVVAAQDRAELVLLGAEEPPAGVR